MEFLRALGSEELARIEPLLRERRFARGEFLFWEGSPAEHLWLLQQGQVRLTKRSADGAVTTLEALGPGEIFGALALEETAYPADAEAVSDGLARRLPRAAARRLVEAHPRLALEILGIVSRRLREAHERLRSFAHDPAPARLALALLRAARAGEARVTRRALAEASGTSVETAIRVLRRFERDGFVRGEVGRVQLLDEPALQRIAAGDG